MHSGVARPGPTRTCALQSTFQALPSPISFDRVIPQWIKCSANNYRSVINIIATVKKPSISLELR